MTLDKVIATLRKELRSPVAVKANDSDLKVCGQILDWLVELKEYKHLYPPVSEKLIPKRRKGRREHGNHKTPDERNACRMREAMETILMAATECDAPYMANALESIIELAHGALVEPPRNCDVGTADDQAERFNRFCEEHACISEDENMCGRCPLGENCSDCEFYWGQLLYSKPEEHKEKT